VVDAAVSIDRRQGWGLVGDDEQFAASFGQSRRIGERPLQDSYGTPPLAEPTFGAMPLRALMP
jgi:hypothetical protein